MSKVLSRNTFCISIVQMSNLSRINNILLFPKFFKNKCSLMMLRTLWIMYSAKLSLTCPCKEVRHASFHHNFPFKVNECLVYKESWGNKLLSLHHTVKIVFSTCKKCVLAFHFTNFKSLKQFSFYANQRYTSKGKLCIWKDIRLRTKILLILISLVRYMETAMSFTKKFSLYTYFVFSIYHT